MARATRTYKLRVSPAGFDLIVDSHAHLVRATRTLLPYGLALHASLYHLAMFDAGAQIDAVRAFPRFSLTAGRNGSTLFVGAPRDMSDLADTLIAQLKTQLSAGQCPGKTDLYLIALRAMLFSRAETLLSAYACVTLKRPGFSGGSYL